MFSYKYIVAMFLLTGNPNDPVLTVDEETAKIMQILAVENEIMDARECTYVLGGDQWRTNWADDVNALRQRWHDLRGVPPSYDMNRLPDSGTVSDYLTFNRAYREQVDNGAIRTDEKCEILREIDNLYNFWDSVRTAKNDGYYVQVRRYAIKHLRDSIGEEDYYAGAFPPYVPLWRFMEINR